LSTSQIKNIIDQAVDLGLLWILLTGGEVFLRKDFIELYLYIKKKGLLVSIFTNATLITKEHAKILKKYPPRDIEISVYGVSPEKYARVTRTNYFTKFMTGIENLVSEAVPFSLKTTIMKANYKELKDITAFCSKYTDDTHNRFRFDPFLMLRTDKNQKRNKDIVNQRLSPDEIIELEKQHPNRLDALKKQCITISEKEPSNSFQERIFKCGAGRNSASIDSYGIFKLCSSLVHKKCVFDLKKDFLKNAWMDFAPKVIAFTSQKKEYHENCSNCKLRDFCTWCPAIGDLETGQLDEVVTYFCSVASARYDYCIKKT
jgi:radical SAM protein with 4Fe4S-binding SPASM domain